MLDRPTAADATLDGPAERVSPRWPLAFVGLAGLLGAGGVAVGAAGAHVGGGDLARTSSEFLMVHAAAVLGGAAAGLALLRSSVLLIAALGLLTVGAALFGGELAVAALLDWRPLPLAAPTGGLCLIAGWLCLAVAGAAAAGGRR
ncbi:DUF423 domain-containing protein [Lichenibacterium dinghuense]|uniref:DUF423 domain-containing protein n=1 Tax=Lichenibacterium dinghuense TaxID=2895977 RepID=UPI001F3DC6C3|nr:DUF423 domain-containing protein [Lichenibacterium sp. 6Y81]